MSTHGSAGASMGNASVSTGLNDDVAQRAREERAEAMAAAVEDIKDRLATETHPQLKKSLKAVLKTAEAEAEQARAEALKGSE